MTYHREPADQKARYGMWRAAVDRDAAGAFRGFGVTVKLDLSADPHEKPTVLPLGYRVGRRGLAHLLKGMRDSGIHHVSLSLASATRPAADMLAELAEEVLPAFHDSTIQATPPDRL